MGLHRAGGNNLIVRMPKGLISNSDDAADLDASI